MNIEKFQEYFEFAPVVMVQGRSFPVEIQYDSTFIDDFLIAVVKKAIQIHIKE
jgi:HrpA-like RNA helicase